MKTSKSSQRQHESPLVGVIMGSDSDWPTLGHSVRILKSLQIACEAKVVSAHRTPDLMSAYAQSAEERGLQCIIAGAGGAAHLPGMVAAMTTVPVLGVPVESQALRGMDSLLSIVQMPGGVPVATFAIGKAGAINAALFAAAQLSRTDPGLLKRLKMFRSRQSNRVRKLKLPATAPK